MSVKNIRIQNRNKILKVLAQRRLLTRQEIALETGMSLPTVASNLEDLIRDGFVREAGMAESRGGRRPLQVEFVPDARYSIGIEVRPGKIKAALTNLYAEPVLKREERLPERLSPAGLSALIERMIRELLREEDLLPEVILGVGIALPGVTDPERKVLEVAPNLHLQNVSFEEFGKLFPFPVMVENEANASALGEHMLNGHCNGEDPVVYISITEGIGAGIIIGGDIYRGANARAGEVGHVTIFPQGRLCNCGKKGCWERYASISALLEDYSFEKKKEEVTLEELLEGLEGGEPEAMTVWDRYVEYLSYGIHNVILSFDPRFVYIGGEIAIFGSRLMDPLNRILLEESSLCEDHDVSILLSPLGGDSALLGAALLPLKSFPLYAG
ncbi:ROK family protein [Spirochaeta thermophila DSM 6578]|uniref:ROK family protein n=1 Tax=Winmispira thermophila (strain ATCC 700085 / DSM 6578 / Z-1203) TaxID=869211 RepID=G0GBD9_WINT7|nr:ROK family transcriptional regulator [Spirochaeta thermophila]AEJ61948.1 ROK family protein [Spirochaeta thermophila DSM 6578]